MFGQKQKAEIVKLVNDRLAERHEIKIIYVKIECLRCGKSFGVSPVNNEISEKDCICQKCMLDKSFE